MIRAERTNGGAVLHLWLAAPKANVLDQKALSGIEGALEKEGAAPELKAIVFEGEGANFSFGASVAEHTKERAPAMLAQFHGVFRQLAEAAVPTCAIVRGQCLGGGLELASWCTWIVASPDAKFGQPEVKLSVFPPMGSILLPWRVGGRAALDLCVSGRSIDAATALQWGLVSAVADDPSAWWEKFFAENIEGASAVGLRFSERGARARLARMLDDELPELERIYLAELMETHDANEGIAAFLERRPPRFTHR